MRYFFRYFLADLRRLIKSLRWLVGILGVALSLFLALEDYLFQKGFVDGNVLATYISASILTGSLIAYSFCAFPFAAAYPEEQEHKYTRYSVVRGNLRAYVAAKTAVIYLSSVTVMVLGTFLFLFLCRTQVPWTDMSKASYEFGMTTCYGSLLRDGHVLLYFALHALHMGMIAGALSSMAALCSVMLSNTVLVYIFPVLAYRIFLTVNIGGYDIYGLTAQIKIFAQDWMDFMLLAALSAAVSVLSGLGCYLRLKRRL